MKKILFTAFLLLNVTNSFVFADCITGYACSIKDLNKNNTNSVTKKEQQNNALNNENSKEKIQTERENIKKRIDKKLETKKEIHVKE